MKKVLFTLIFGLSLIGCNKEANPLKPDTTTPPAVEEEKEILCIVNGENLRRIRDTDVLKCWE